jgi:hypothetical protein
MWFKEGTSDGTQTWVKLHHCGIKKCLRSGDDFVQRKMLKSRLVKYTAEDKLR